MAYLVPDKITNMNGVTVKEYLLTAHNPNGIAMPRYNLPDKLVGITIHNTQSISVSADTTMAEQYTRATKNGNMGDVRVHFYVDDKEAWQGLPLNLSGWHAADGDGAGNRKTIAIECIMDNSTGLRNEKAEENCAKLTAYLLDKYGLTVNDVYTHQHWYSKKYCPLYILPHWDAFINKVKKYIPKNETITNSPVQIYRIRKSWDDAKSQIGAYANLESAKSVCKEGYFVFDENGNVVYPVDNKDALPTVRKGDKGSRVKAVQALLIGYGYNLNPYGADGSFGSLTETRVKEYQSKNGLTVDGVVGTNTWNKLLGLIDR